MLHADEPNVTLENMSENCDFKQSKVQRDPSYHVQWATLVYFKKK